MLIPIFTVFVDNPNTDYQEKVISGLIQENMAYNIDSLNGNYKNSLVHFVHSPHRFYFISDVLKSCVFQDLDEYEWVKPVFAINYSQKDEIDDNDWGLIYRFLDNLFFPKNNPTLTVTTRRGKELLNKPVKLEPYVKPAESLKMDITTPSFYSFDQYYLEEMDIMLCCVEKPHVDLPYVVVIRDYTVNGLKPLFTSIFISSSWGVSRYDVEYLRHLWHEKEMQGEFDIDKMLKEATEACYPSDGSPGNSEPEVYRKEFNQVIQYFRNKPFITKRKATSLDP